MSMVQTKQKDQTVKPKHEKKKREKFHTLKEEGEDQISTISDSSFPIKKLSNPDPYIELTNKSVTNIKLVHIIQQINYYAVQLNKVKG